MLEHLIKKKLKGGKNNSVLVKEIANNSIILIYFFTVNLLFNMALPPYSDLNKPIYNDNPLDFIFGFQVFEPQLQVRF
jgi:hypothetical protein